MRELVLWILGGYRHPHVIKKSNTLETMYKYVLEVSSRRKWSKPLADLVKFTKTSGKQVGYIFCFVSLILIAVYRPYNYDLGLPIVYTPCSSHEYWL